MKKQEAIKAVEKAKKVYANLFYNNDSNEYFEIKKQDFLDTLESLQDDETVTLQDNGDTVIVG